ncbi:hypothetical protein L9F63_020686, partial [Diploptera punctata]
QDKRSELIEMIVEPRFNELGTNIEQKNYIINCIRILVLRSVVRFLWAKGHKPSEIHRDMRGVYGDDLIRHAPAGDNSSNPAECQRHEAAILNYRRVQLRALSQKFNISYGAVLDHLTRYTAQGHDFLEGIVTGDESWAYHYTPETKQASMEWKQAGSPVKKKFKKFLAGKRFETDMEVKSAVRRWLHSNQTDFYEQGILKLIQFKFGRDNMDNKGALLPKEGVRVPLTFNPKFDLSNLNGSGG